MTTTSKTTSWETLLTEEKQSDYFKKIIEQLNNAYHAGKTIYPPKPEIFNAFKYTAYEDIKVVIIGQDPYHGPGQAHGLCFSVKDPVPPPPSLKNIYKELARSCAFNPPQSGDLSSWAKQGVLMLNATLTVEAGQPQSHANWGWQQFTDKIMTLLNEHPNSPLIFLLWGSFAKKKAQLIDPKRHHILSAPHPSPLSAHRGFIGCDHFKKTNELLIAAGKTPIDWQV